MTRLVAIRAHPAAPWVAAAWAVLAWGATPAATKLAVTAIDPLALGMLRSVLAGVVALPVALGARQALPGDRREWRLLLISALCGFAGFPILFTLALAHTSTSHAALILAAAPIFTSLIGLAVERRMPGRAWWLGLVLAFAGEAALVGLSAHDSGEASPAGDLVALVSSLMVATGYVAGSRLSKTMGSWGVTLWGVAIAAAVQFPFAAWALAHDALGGVDTTGWGALAYLAFVSSLVAYASWYWALAAGGVARIAPMQFLQPLVALVLAAVIFAEMLTLPLLVAGSVILIGVAVARRGQPDSRHGGPIPVVPANLRA